jgi:hypothetical protein
MIYLSINICLSMAFVPLRVTVSGKSRHCCALASLLGPRSASYSQPAAMLGRPAAGHSHVWLATAGQQQAASGQGLPGSSVDPPLKAGCFIAPRSNFWIAANLLSITCTHIALILHLLHIVYPYINHVNHSHSYMISLSIYRDLYMPVPCLRAGLFIYLLLCYGCALLHLVVYVWWFSCSCW